MSRVSGVVWERWERVQRWDVRVGGSNEGSHALSLIFFFVEASDKNSLNSTNSYYFEKPKGVLWIYQSETRGNAVESVLF